MVGDLGGCIDGVGVDDGVIVPWMHGTCTAVTRPLRVDRDGMETARKNGTGDPHD